MMRKPIVQPRHIHWLGVLSGIMLASAPATTLAQIAGDGTLGTQVNGSTLAPCSGICAINGGTERGVNLYHSFKEFSIPTGGQAWFNNAPQIQNILTRVTGNTLSKIDGLLKANGTANLFLLNPNGIVFGPYARLQIGGSFLATTASSFKFSDGSEFSAIKPQAPPLLTVNVTPGLQYVPTAASITNRGNLSAGQDLTLAASNLDLQGTVQAGRDLTLQAQDTVQIRDSAIVPLVVQSGRDLTIQGNQRVDIVALNHPQTPIQSGGNLRLISNGNISGDAHLNSGGNLSFQTLSGTPGTFVSKFDPIIYANGNVVFGDYTGVALKIEAIGSIEGGNIRVTGPDITVPVGDPDFATLTGGPSVILRAGVTAIPTPNLPQTGGGTNFISVATSPGQVPGITVASINTSSIDGGDSGFIELTAKGNITTTGSFSYPFGETTLGSFSYSTTGNAGNGGKISLVAGGSIFTSNIDSSSFSFNTQESTNGGAISLTAGGSISLRDLNSSTTSNYDDGNSGNGGAISLTSGGAISLRDLSSYSYASTSTVTNEGNSGNGGAISLTSGGAISARNIDSSSVSDFEDSGNGGAISFIARGSISTISLNSASYSTYWGTAGNGGAISFFSTAGNILPGFLSSASYSYLGAAGNGGAIFLSAREGEIGNSQRPSSLYSYTVSEQGIAGNAGNVVLEAKYKVSSLELLTLSSSAHSGSFQLTGFEDLSITNTNILTSKQFTIRVPATAINRGVATLNVGRTGQAGDVSLTSLGNLAFNNSSIQSDTKGSDSAGNVSLVSPGLITFNNSRIISSTSSTGQAGSIGVTAGQGISLTNGSQLSARTSNAGTAGNITLNAPLLTIAGDAQVLAETQGRGQGGSIIINAPIAVNLTRVQDFSPVLSVEASGAGKAGDIVINTPNLTLANLARITATSTSTATNLEGGGSITLNASNVYLAGIVGVFAETQGASPAGTLRLNPYQNQPDLGIALTLNSRISASTSGSGNGGDLSLTAPRSITIAGSGQLAVETSSTGNAGNINITTQQLTLTDGVQLSASTSGRGKAGDIEVTASTVNLNQGAQVFTNTFADGQAGNISLHVQDAVTLSGNRTGLFASTTAGSMGNGGNIIIDPRTVFIQDGAAIAVNSQGSGQGGNIQIQAGRLNLDRQGVISAQTASSQGGNITLNVPDLLLLRHGSQISTSAGTAQTSGDGGKITINSRFIVAVLAENSDITANAFTGSGGSVDITAQGIFGLRVQPQLTPLSDITASSRFGINGTVTLNVLNLDPSRGLVALPVNLTDPSQQISQSCTPGGKASASSFVSTGRGGIPLNPDEPLESRAVVTKWVALPEGRAGGVRQEGAGGVRQTSNDRAWRRSANQVSEPIVEAQGWLMGADGMMELFVASPTPNPASVWTASVDCQTVQGR